MMIEWTDRFDTGIAEVDHDHRRLVDLINQLDVILSDAGDLGRVGAVVDALVDYTDYHFQREERMLDSMGYDGAVAHAEVHAQFGHFLGNLVGVCMLHPDRANLLKLSDYLKSWLIDHILVEDMKFATLLRDQAAHHG